MRKLLILSAVLLPLWACSSFDSFRGDQRNDAAEAVTDETFLLVVNSLQYVDPGLTSLTIKPLSEAENGALANFTIIRASQCEPAGLVTISGNSFTVPTPSGGSGSCDGMATLIDGDLFVELNCLNYRAPAGDVTIDGIIQYEYTQVAADIEQFDIFSENPLGLDYNGDNCSGFLNYQGTVDGTADKPYSVDGCLDLVLCGPKWSVTGEESSL